MPDTDSATNEGVGSGGGGGWGGHQNIYRLTNMARIVVGWTQVNEETGDGLSYVQMKITP